MSQNAVVPKHVRFQKPFELAETVNVVYIRGLVFSVAPSW